MPTPPTTRWSVVLLATDPQQPQYREAFEYLCGAYWKPLYAYARRRGLGPEPAEDSVQEFFAVLFEREYLRRFSRSQSRFRSFMLVCFRNFLENQREQAATEKRGGKVSVIPLDRPEAERLVGDGAGSRPPDEAFDRDWAVCVLARARERLRSEWEEAGKGPFFEALEASLPPDLGRLDYAAVGELVEMTPNAVKTAVHRLRKAYGERLKDEIRQTIAEGEDVETELRYLMELL